MGGHAMSGAGKSGPRPPIPVGRLDMRFSGGAGERRQGTKRLFIGGSVLVSYRKQTSTIGTNSERTRKRDSKCSYLYEIKHDKRTRNELVFGPEREAMLLITHNNGRLERTRRKAPGRWLAG